MKFEVKSFLKSESYVVLKLNGSKKFNARDIPNGTTQG
jgi:hypothetical protein